MTGLKKTSILRTLILTCCFMIFFSLSCFASSYSKDWVYWSQSDSDDPTMRDYGCFVVALARLLAASGIETSPDFNPDTFRDWEKNNGFLDSNFYQQNIGNCLRQYAIQKGLDGLTISCLGRMYSECVYTIWQNIKDNCYSIIQYDSGTTTGHWVLVCNQVSQETGTIHIYQSGYPNAKGIQPMPNATIKCVWTWGCTDSINLSKTSVSLYTGDSYQLSASVIGGPGTTQWVSSNPAVASVSSTGLVQAKSAGTAEITAKYNEASVKCVVSVKNKVVPVSIKIKPPKKIIINKGKTYQLRTVTTGKGGKVTYKVDKKKIASVSDKGLVKARRKGTTVVKAYFGGKSASCTVQVVVPSLKISKKKITLKVGKTKKIKATVKGASKKVTWKSSNTSVALVSGKGVVKAVGSGKATISATANGITKKCKVTVKKTKKAKKTIASGKCGTNVSWMLNSSGTLTISGKGPMKDYMREISDDEDELAAYLSKPWDKYRSKINKIVIKSGVTSIGENAFSGLAKVTSIIIAGSVKKIGFNAFCGCSKLQKVTIPEGLRTIDAYAFACCYKLRSIVLPKSIKSKSYGFDDTVFTDVPLLNIYYRGTKALWKKNVCDWDELMSDEEWNDSIKLYFNYQGS